MKRILVAFVLSSMLSLWAGSTTGLCAAPEPLPRTAALTMEGDITSQLVDGADRFLLRKLEESVARRPGFW